MLIDALRARLRGDASSFRLMGEDLQLVTLDEVVAAVGAQYARIAPPIRDELLAEERALADDAHAWLCKHNRSLHGRVAGYLALGRWCAFRYPWPIVAILGIVQVMAGMERARLYGVVGQWARRLGYRRLERLGDASEDVLRRTNRGIFADSVPTVLRALRAEQLRGAGETALADALIEGHAAVLWDGESARLCRMIADGLAIADEAQRFRALADATLRHFAREQAIFTHHIGSRPGQRRGRAMRSIPAPVIERGKLVFRPFRLPPAFDLQDHAARVDAFGRAFVRSITGSIDDYRIATDWVLEHFGAHTCR